MDSFNYGLVAERLGLPLKYAEQRTAAVIIDGQVNLMKNHAAKNSHRICILNNFRVHLIVGRIILCT